MALPLFLDRIDAAPVDANTRAALHSLAATHAFLADEGCCDDCLARVAGAIDRWLITAEAAA